jgi:uncharacterized membrane protein YqjE
MSRFLNIMFLTPHEKKAQGTNAETAVSAPKMARDRPGPMATLGILRAASGAICGQVALHAELASVEWAIEKTRLLKLAICGVIAMSFGLCLLLSTGALVLAFSWNTPYRVVVAISLIVLYVLAIFLALRRAQALSLQGGQSFAQTRAQMAADLALVRNAL